MILVKDLEMEEQARRMGQLQNGQEERGVRGDMVFYKKPFIWFIIPILIVRLDLRLGLFGVDYWDSV